MAHLATENELARFGDAHLLQNQLGSDATPEESAKLENSLFYAQLFGTDPDKMYEHTDAINESVYGGPSNTGALKNNQRMYEQSKSWTKAINDGLDVAGIEMNRSMKQAGYFVADLDRAFWKLIGKKQPEFLRKMGEQQFEITEMSLAAIDQWYKENPDKMAEASPDTGLMEKAVWYAKNPKVTLQNAAQSAPIMLLGVLGKTAGLGKIGMTALFGGPVTAEVYSEARAEGQDITPALIESLLTGAGEGAIEQWTFGKKLGLFQNFGNIVKAGFPKVAMEGFKAYGRGFAEEGGQALNRNFWRFIFSDANQSITEGVGDAAAAGGPVELLMAGVFGISGYAYNKTQELVGRKVQEQRLQQIRSAVDNNEHLTQEQKAEIFTELDSVAQEVDEGSLQQMDTAMRLPVSVKGALMPDAHQGYGLPI